MLQRATQQLAWSPHAPLIPSSYKPFCTGPLVPSLYNGAHSSDMSRLRCLGLRTMLIRPLTPTASCSAASLLRS